VVWSEPKTDKLVPGCFVKTAHHETGMPSDTSTRISVDPTYVSRFRYSALHGDVDMMNMSVEDQNVVRRE
jgi:hypothetical protein